MEIVIIETLKKEMDLEGKQLLDKYPQRHCSVQSLHEPGGGMCVIAVSSVSSAYTWQWIWCKLMNAKEREVRELESNFKRYSW
jgi:hypothetical protein